MDNQIFAMRLKELRCDKKSLTQQELANRIGVSKMTVFNYENDVTMPDIDILIRLANFFDVPTDYLLGRTKNLLREDEMVPYIREEKIPFFKAFVSPDYQDEKQIVENYIPKPYSENKEYDRLFAYEISQKSDLGFDIGDIVYLLRISTYQKDDPVLMYEGTGQVGIIHYQHEKAELIIGKVIGVYKSLS